MLSWFVAATEVESALKKEYKIDEDQVQCRPELVPSACIEEEVDMPLVRHYFTDRAWQAVEVVMSAKSNSDVHTCGACRHTLGVQSVGCDCCLRWFDFKCVGLKAAPKASRWFCRGCRASFTSQ